MKVLSVLILFLAVAPLNRSHAFTLGCDEHTQAEYAKIANGQREQSLLIEKSVLAKINAGTDRQNPAIVLERETMTDLEASALANISCASDADIET